MLLSEIVRACGDDELPQGIRLRVALDVLEQLADEDDAASRGGEAGGLTLEMVEITDEGRARLATPRGTSGTLTLIWEILAGRRADSGALPPLHDVVDEIPADVSEIIAGEDAAQVPPSELLERLETASRGYVDTHADVHDAVRRVLDGPREGASARPGAAPEIAPAIAPAPSEAPKHAAPAPAAVAAPDLPPPPAPDAGAARSEPPPGAASGASATAGAPSDPPFAVAAGSLPEIDVRPPHGRDPLDTQPGIPSLRRLSDRPPPLVARPAVPTPPTVRAAAPAPRPLPPPPKAPGARAASAPATSERGPEQAAKPPPVHALPPAPATADAPRRLPPPKPPTRAAAPPKEGTPAPEVGTQTAEAMPLLPLAPPARPPKKDPAPPGGKAEQAEIAVLPAPPDLPVTEAKVVIKAPASDAAKAPSAKRAESDVSTPTRADAAGDSSSDSDEEETPVPRGRVKKWAKTVRMRWATTVRMEAPELSTGDPWQAARKHMKPATAAPVGSSGRRMMVTIALAALATVVLLALLMLSDP